jgi:hypothetical protein
MKGLTKDERRVLNPNMFVTWASAEVMNELVRAGRIILLTQETEDGPVGLVHRIEMGMLAWRVCPEEDE